MILLTTSDHAPKKGGLSTFTENIKKVLSDLGEEYEVFHWKNRSEIQDITAEKMKEYSRIINIHAQFCWEQKSSHQKMINFIHGSESLMTSPNMLKRIVKGFRKGMYFKRMESADFNVFISEATFKKTNARGFSGNYSRDLILHNCINTEVAKFIEKNLQDDWVFSCIVRDVPHKNLKGTLRFCEDLQRMSGKKIELIVPSSAVIESSEVKITKLQSEEDECRNRAYQRSHFNLLFSLDHSHKGYYEGFGLTVLEAAMFGTPSLVLSTGGLPEAVHHLKTGWVFDSLDEASLREFLMKLNPAFYQGLAQECFRHTIESHGLLQYHRLLLSLIGKEKAA